MIIGSVRPFGEVTRISRTGRAPNVDDGVMLDCGDFAKSGPRTFRPKAGCSSS